MTVTIRHYDTQGLDTYTEGALLVERDDIIVRVDAVVGDQDDHPFGRPGTSLEMSPEEASVLAVQLLSVTGLTGYPCGSGDLCSTKGISPGFFNIRPIAGWHEKLDDAIDCVRQAARAKA